jgi:hypothetical protein
MESEGIYCSNQLGTYGIDTMRKVNTITVFLYGMRGVSLYTTYITVHNVPMFSLVLKSQRI